MSVLTMVAFLVAILITFGVGIASAFYSKLDGVITTRNNVYVYPVSENGDYEFVLSGASDGGNEDANIDEPLDRGLMEEQGFTLLVVRGSKDRRSEIWARENTGQSQIEISGNANDVAYCVLTIYKNNFNFDISQDIKTVTKYSTHGSSSVPLQYPTQAGLKIASIFFDDPIRVTGAPAGFLVSSIAGHGDGDGFAAVMHEPASYPPTSLPIERLDSSGASQYVSVGISINVAGNTGRNQGKVLGVSQRLLQAQFLESGNREYRCYFQKDGNLVLRNQAGDALWASGSSGQGGSYVIMQSDGNLVINTATDDAIWSSGTQGTSATKFVIKGYGKIKLEASDGTDVKVYP